MGDINPAEDKVRERIEHELKDEIADLDVSDDALELVTGGAVNGSDGPICGPVA
jgi:hypothetical protein